MLAMTSQHRFDPTDRSRHCYLPPPWVVPIIPLGAVVGRVPCQAVRAEVPAVPLVPRCRPVCRPVPPVRFTLRASCMQMEQNPRFILAPWRDILAGAARTRTQCVKKPVGPDEGSGVPLTVTTLHAAAASQGGFADCKSTKCGGCPAGHFPHRLLAGGATHQTSGLICCTCGNGSKTTTAPIKPRAACSGLLHRHRFRSSHPHHWTRH